MADKATDRSTTSSDAVMDEMQTRHRKELKELQGKITNKKKNATKKTRKGVNDECAELERQLREVHLQEVAAAKGEDGEDPSINEDGVDQPEKGLQTAQGGDAANTRPQPQQSPQQQQQPAQAGKKRNRQKERLARRAAEQEAEAQRAEEEASHMTDHRARESEYMKKTFQQYGLVERDIEPDGHCLFSAVADQLSQHAIPLSDRATAAAPTGDVAADASSGGEPGYRTVRKMSAEYMLQHGDDFAPFLEEDLEDYAAKMRDTAEWGGQLELMALARRYGVQIRVVQDGRMDKIGEEDGSGGRVLWLAYYRHGYGLGEHYNSLRKKT